jgi:TAT (twin-arginine translocation) pathway signal sequence
MGFERLLKPGKDKVEAVPPGISRRNFLVTGAAAGGGLLLGFYVPVRIDAKAQLSSEEIFSPNAFVRIRPDDSITLIMPQVEMGDKARTPRCPCSSPRSWRSTWQG